jgi:hypothetical protein
VELLAPGGRARGNRRLLSAAKQSIALSSYRDQWKGSVLTLPLVGREAAQQQGGVSNTSHRPSLMIQKDPSPSLGSVPPHKGEGQVELLAPGGMVQREPPAPECSEAINCPEQLSGSMEGLRSYPPPCGEGGCVAAGRGFEHLAASMPYNQKDPTPSLRSVPPHKGEGSGRSILKHFQTPEYGTLA